MLRTLPIWVFLLVACGSRTPPPEDPVVSNSPASQDASRLMDRVEQLGAEIERAVAGARDAHSAADRAKVRQQIDVLDARCDELTGEIDAQRGRTTEREVRDRLGALDRVVVDQQKVLANLREAMREP